MSEALAYTKPQAAGALGISVRHLEREIRAGRLSVVKIGRSVRVPREELEAYIRTRTTRHRTTPCPTNARARRTGTPASQSAVDSLDARLEQLTGGKQKESKPTGAGKPDLKLIRSK